MLKYLFPLLFVFITLIGCDCERYESQNSRDSVSYRTFTLTTVTYEGHDYVVCHYKGSYRPVSLIHSASCLLCSKNKLKEKNNATK